jgi:hypothetical protein
LLPAGFSAEHLGPNNYYYWDDFWSVAGLRAAAHLLGDPAAPETAEFSRCADLLMQAVERSLNASAWRRNRPGIPAAPDRRMDSGAVGSLAVSYPLQLWPPRDPRLLDTVDFLMTRCFVDGGFFQDMIHSGINPYLTLHVAQVLLRAGNPGFFGLVNTVADLASPTGQWPEAIHPRTLGGCMGDGQHAWAAAEWVLMVRNMFVREEQGRLILGSGIPASWLEQPEPIHFGPTATQYGRLTVRITCGGRPHLDWQWETGPHGLNGAEQAVIEPQLPAEFDVISSGTHSSAASAAIGPRTVMRQSLPANQTPAHRSEAGGGEL